MTADEIRALTHNQLAVAKKLREETGAPLYTHMLSLQALNRDIVLCEIAAQLAELNDTLKGMRGARE